MDRVCKAGHTSSVGCAFCFLAGRVFCARLCLTCTVRGSRHLTLNFGSRMRPGSQPNTASSSHFAARTEYEEMVRTPPALAFSAQCRKSKRSAHNLLATSPRFPPPLPLPLPPPPPFPSRCRSPSHSIPSHPSPSTVAG
mmetsp:Transcript_24542/g.53396  ORF Transcript_24542/g.53396 Transcript_24542/m.53396 type:complete len:139 (-) Transcript_24542:205-621(-)